MKILITGANGIIARQLSEELLVRGHKVVFLSRNPKPINGCKAFGWNVDTGFLDEAALEGTDSIVHLAGAGIADKKWTPERKKEIIKSRTESIRLLYSALSRNTHQVRAVVSAGGIGYYGNRGDDWLNEESKPGSGFLSESCIEWEKAVSEGRSLGLNLCQFRIGMVLSRLGGGLKPLENLTRFSLGSPLDTGKQWISWIHINDLTRLFIKAIETDTLQGIYNAVAPIPIINEDFTTALAKAMDKPHFLPNVPGFILRMVLGEMAAIVTDSTRVQDRKLEAAGFEFRFKSIDKAFQDLYPSV